MEIIKSPVVHRSGGGKRDEIAHRRHLGQWKHAVWHYDDGYISLCICPNPQNVPPQEWTLKWSVNFGWFWCGDVGPHSVKKKCTILVSYVDNGRQYPCMREGNICKISITFSQF